jgi:hypothetical protein
MSTRGVWTALLPVGIAVIIVAYLLFPASGTKKEGFIAPYYVNQEKLDCDYYPKANGDLYGPCSNLLTGFPFYDRAY